MPLTNINPLQPVISVTASFTITPATENVYYGQTLHWRGAFTVTLGSGLSSGFNFAGKPPPSGNASIASDGVVLLNGATTTLTRTLASNILFAVLQDDPDSYSVNGS